MINFNSLKEGFILSNPEYLRTWLKAVIESEKKKQGDIQFVFCDDDYLLTINRDYLNHDILTDIITFPTSNDTSVVSGEIYISVDRVTENATIENVIFGAELNRVMVHGVLHLMGYKDHQSDEKIQMRSKEDYYLNLQPGKNS